jgi:transposase
MKALSMDLRERILTAVLEGNESMPKVAARFSVSHKVVQKLKYQWRDLGTLEPQTHKVGRKRLLSDKQCERLGELIRNDPSLTLEQLRSKLRVDCCLKTIWMELRRQGHTHKKRRFMPASKSEATSKSEG